MKLGSSIKAVVRVVAANWGSNELVN